MANSRTRQSVHDDLGHQAMKILSVVGARPQFIKAAVVSRVLRADDRFEERLLHTGQHYDENMSDVFFAELDIPLPDYNLGVGSASHGAQTARMLESIEEVLITDRPDWVLVYGDTNSTLAGALAAAKVQIPVAHVEAGLRSFSRRMPEEINRVLTDHAADLLLAPTRQAVENLRREGLSGERVRLVGDVMYDAALHYAARAERHSDVLDRLRLRPREFVLVTLHRAENTDEQGRLESITRGLSMAATFRCVVWPVHPRTRKRLDQFGLLDTLRRSVRIIEPVGYLDMVRLERAAALIATDSGGVQKEAFFHRVPCVTLRDETEWLELVELGCNRLCPPEDARAIRNAILGGLDPSGSPPDFEARPYGDGHAAEKIAAVLASCGLSSADRNADRTSPRR